MQQKMPLLGVALLAAGVGLAHPSTGYAQQVSINPYAGYNVDGEELLVGAGVSLPVRMGMATLLVTPGIEYYPSIEGGSLYTFIVDVYYPIPVPRAAAQPYIGGGLAINRASVDVPVIGSLSATNSQLNAIGGVVFGVGRFRPFVEGNLRFIDGSALVVKGGGRIALGR